MNNNTLRYIIDHWHQFEKWVKTALQNSVTNETSINTIDGNLSNLVSNINFNTTTSEISFAYLDLEGNLNSRTIDLSTLSQSQFQIKNIVSQFDDLSSIASPSLFEFAKVETSQGLQWLPGSLGGTYYGPGLYMWDGANWTSDNDQIYEELNNILIRLNQLVDGVTNGAGISVDNTDSNNPIISLDTTILNSINNAIESGDNISELNNNVGYITTETDPFFNASEASNFVTGDKTNLDNQSGINTGDETTGSIQSKRPLKTIEGNSIEGTGNIDLTATDVGLGNVPNINAISRLNHTGTQLHTTISDFDFGVQQNRLDQMALPSTSVFFNNQLIKNVGSPVDLTDAAREIDTWSVGIKSDLGLINQQANTFEPFFIREPLPNVNQATGVWTIIPPFTGELELTLSGICSYNQITSNIMIHLLRDNIIQNFEYHVEPKDATGTGLVLPIVQNSTLTGQSITTGTNQFLPAFGGTTLISCTQNIPITLKLEFTGENAFQEAAIYSASIIVKRFKNKNI